MIINVALFVATYMNYGTSKKYTYLRTIIKVQLLYILIDFLQLISIQYCMFVQSVRVLMELILFYTGLQGRWHYPLCVPVVRLLLIEYRIE